ILLVFGGHLAGPDHDPAYAREAADPPLDIPLQLGSERTTGRGQRHPDGDRAVRTDVAALVHPQVDQVVAELGVDHAPHGALHQVLSHHGSQCTGVDRLRRVDRLSLFKVLADRSRYAIYQEVTRAQEPLSTIEIADRLDLHPNTVRLHLEKLREIGLVTVSTDPHGSVGRPQHRWATGPHAPSPRLEPAALRLLAHLP